MRSSSTRASTMSRASSLTIVALQMSLCCDTLEHLHLSSSLPEDRRRRALHSHDLLLKTEQVSGTVWYDVRATKQDHDRDSNGGREGKRLRRLHHLLALAQKSNISMPATRHRSPMKDPEPACTQNRQVEAYKTRYNQHHIAHEKAHLNWNLSSFLSISIHLLNPTTH